MISLISIIGARSSVTREFTRSISFIIQMPIEMSPARSCWGSSLLGVLEVVEEDHPETAQVEERVDPLAR